MLTHPTCPTKPQGKTPPLRGLEMKKTYVMIYNRYKQLNFLRKLCLDKFYLCFPFCSSFSIFFVAFQKSSQTIYVSIQSSSTIFQSKSLREAFSKVEGDGVSDHPLEHSHTINKGFPHNPFHRINYLEMYQIIFSMVLALLNGYETQWKMPWR